MSKVPTRSPSHREIEYAKLAGLGLDLDDIAEDGTVELATLVELAEDRGRPPSHYLAGLALASEHQLASGTCATTVVACAGKCQSWGALDTLDHLVEAWHAKPGRFALAVRSCLDQCDRAAVIRIDSPAGTVVVTEATAKKLDEALAALEV
jgi:NADH:ubiquinone oxidoreductase subunit E